MDSDFFLVKIILTWPKYDHVMPLSAIAVKETEALERCASEVETIPSIFFKCM